MLSALKVPVVYYRRLPPLFYLSLGALLGLLLTAYVLGERAEQKNIELLKEFGTSVVSMAAKEVVDAAVSENLVSMHAVMQEVVAQPRIQMATVHNLEQQLLVQAGQVKVGVPHQIYSAPIPLHDSLAGHVTIAVDSSFSGDQAVRWTLSGTAFLLCIMLVLTLYETRGKAWYWRKLERPVDRDLDLDDNQRFDDHHGLDGPELEPIEAAFDPADLQAVAAEPSLDLPFHRAPPETNDEESFGIQNTDVLVDDLSGDPDDESYDDDIDDDKAREILFDSDLILALPNRTRLEKQLNSEIFIQLTSSFEHALDEVLKLYGGNRVGTPHNGNVHCIRFSSTESAPEAAFRAACTAYLVAQLTQSHKIRFNLLAEICLPETDIKLAVSDTGIYLQEELVDDVLLTRLEVAALGDGRLRLEGFKAPFASLLERQQQQLLGVF